MNEWLDLAKTFGIPTVMLFGLSMGVWRTLAWLGSWVKPLVEKMAAQHIEFVDHVQRCTDCQTEAIIEVRELVSRKTDAIEIQTETISELRKIIESQQKDSSAATKQLISHIETCTDRQTEALSHALRRIDQVAKNGENLSPPAPET